MWLYIGFCIALFYVVNTQSNSPDNEPEEQFVDVIKNISRVNNVLQELISNYETLQKLYKSQENIDSSKYSDSDMDELFQNIKKESRSQTSKATKKEKFAATEMYWSDHEEETKNHNIYQSKEDHKKKGNVVDRDKNVVKQKPRTSTTTLKPEEFSSSESSDPAENVENMLKEKIEMSPQYAKTNHKVISKSKMPQTGFDGYATIEKLLQPFIDTKSAKPRSRKIYRAKEKNANYGLNIPHLTVSNGVKAVDLSQNTIKVKKNYSTQADVSNNKRTHKKNKHSDTLPTKKDFYDLLKDKPIQLEAHSDIYMESVKTPVKNRDKQYRDKIVTHTNKRRDIDKLEKNNNKHIHKKEYVDKLAVNATHLKVLRTENLRVAKSNDTHHQNKKHLKKFDDDTQIMNNDHKKIDHDNNNNNHKSVDNEARDTNNDSKKTQDDSKRHDTSYEKEPNYHKKANKRHKKADIEPETNYKDHKMVNNNEEQRGTEGKTMKKKKLYKETQVTHETQSSDESVSMDKNDTNVLREAYGEVCMKVVVRKCFKACTKTSRVVCSQTKCKSALKSAVRENAKAGCLERFTAVDERSAQNQTKTQNLKSVLENDKSLFSHKRRVLQENVNNLSAGGFHACLPTLSVQMEPTLESSTNETNLLRRKMKQKTKDEKVSFNILRDRFERACKKLSYEKCHDACKSSWDSACTTYDCSKRLKKLYKNSCKNSCKNAYGLTKKTSSDSDDSSTSDDSSNSS